MEKILLPSDIEQVDSFYIDETQLKKQPVTVYRININGGRTYYTVNDKGEPTFYISLTTLTRNTLPTSEFLIKWMCQMGYDESKEYADERANYGTTMHLAFGEFLTKKEWNFNITGIWIQQQVNEGKIKPCNLERFTEDLNYDLAAFAQFVVDYKVKPIAIELILVSKDGYGTLIDLVCRMMIQVDGLDYDNPYKSGERKGQPREVKVGKMITALLNFKSGRKGFYEDMEIQLEFEKRLFEENYPDIKIDAIYNFSPKEWRSAPTYNLKDQSDSLVKEKADALLAIAKIELIKRLPKKTIIEGTVKMGEPAKVVEQDVADYIKALYKPLPMEEVV